MTAVRENTTVYIVEDSRTILNHLRLMIEELADVEVLGNSSRAGDAIARIRELRPEIVTLDLRLSEGSGVDVLRAIKNDPNPPVVIVLTNFSESPYRTHCKNLGADFFFDKTIDFPLVLDLIGNYSASLRRGGDHP